MGCSWSCPRYMFRQPSKETKKKTGSSQTENVQNLYSEPFIPFEKTDHSENVKQEHMQWKTSQDTMEGFIEKHSPIHTISIHEHQTRTSNNLPEFEQSEYFQDLVPETFINEEHGVSREEFVMEAAEQKYIVWGTAYENEKGFLKRPGSTRKEHCYTEGFTHTSGLFNAITSDHVEENENDRGNIHSDKAFSGELHQNLAYSTNESWQFPVHKYVSIGNRGVNIGGFGCQLTLGSEFTFSVMGKDLITTKESSEQNLFGFFQK